MVKKVKDIFSRLNISQQRKKKLVIINYSKGISIILDLLWKQGFIYGYFFNKITLSYSIFIKYSKNSNCLLKNLTFSNRYTNYKELSSLFFREKNILIFLFNEKGLFFISSFLNRGLGGSVIIKL